MLIFLYGNDQFRSHQKLIEIKNKYLKSDKTGSGLSVFDCEEEKEIGQKIKNIINTPNLLAPKRLLIVKRIIDQSSDQEQKKVLEFLKTNLKKIDQNKNVVVVFWENNQPKKSNALYKFLESHLDKTRKQNFVKLSGIKLETWVLKTLKEIDPNAQISDQALKKLIAYCAGNSLLLFSEMQKLTNYTAGQMISEKEVELLVRARLNSNIFQMVDALGNNNKKEALELLYMHLENGDDPYYLMSMFFYQFRNLLKVADFKNQGIFSEYEIAKMAKLHPFVVKKSLRQINSFSWARLKEVYKQLGVLDTQIKTGKINIKLALDKFVVEL